jgi:hypothetical protein
VKRLIPKIIILAAIAVLPLLVYNLILDPYSVLRKDFKHMIICPNERIVKTDHILKNPGKYDSLIFGSSRVSQVPVDVINRATGWRCYNMSFASGVVVECRDTMKLLIRRGVSIKNVIVGLDYFSFQSLPPANQVRTMMYPDSLWGAVKMYYTFLTLEPDTSILHEVRFDGTNAFYDITEGGGYDLIRKERDIRLHPEKHPARFAQPIMVVCTRRLPETMDEIRDIIELCAKNNITLKFFFNPGHASSYLCDDMEFMNSVRKQLAAITDYWDFTRPGPVTMDNFNYSDIIHYRKNVGKMVMERMFKPDRAGLGNFGFHVTRKNVDDYLKTTGDEYRTLKKKINPPCMTCEKKQQ